MENIVKLNKTNNEITEGDGRGNRKAWLIIDPFKFEIKFTPISKKGFQQLFSFYNREKSHEKCEKLELEFIPMQTNLRIITRKYSN